MSRRDTTCSASMSPASVPMRTLPPSSSIARTVVPVRSTAPSSAARPEAAPRRNVQDRHSRRQARNTPSRVLRGRIAESADGHPSDSASRERCRTAPPHASSWRKTRRARLPDAPSPEPTIRHPHWVRSFSPVSSSSSRQISWARSTSGTYASPSPTACRVIRVSPCVEP